MRRPHPDRQGENLDPAARPAALRPGLRGLGLRRPAEAWPSSSTARSTWCPRAETKTVIKNGGTADDRPGRPRCADRPLQADRLRRQDRLPGQYADICAEGWSRRSAYTGQNGKSYTPRTSRSRPPAARSQGPRKRHQPLSRQRDSLVSSVSRRFHAASPWPAAAECALSWTCAFEYIGVPLPLER